MNFKNYIFNLGADLVGFADLTSITNSPYKNLNYGIAIALSIDPKVICDIKNSPTESYYTACKTINNKLDLINKNCVSFIKNQGYIAIGQDSTYITTSENLSTPLPHKTIATRAGLGWIGKNALLITKEYGSAIRLTSIITNMPLKTDLPINKSNCGLCTKCKENCPASAINGVIWNTSVSRDTLINPYKCRTKARELLYNKIKVKSAICGKCIEICPFTQHYINSSLSIAK